MKSLECGWLHPYSFCAHIWWMTVCWSHIRVLFGRDSNRLSSTQAGYRNTFPLCVIQTALWVRFCSDVTMWTSWSPPTIKSSVTSTTYWSQLAPYLTTGGAEAGIRRHRASSALAACSGSGSDRVPGPHRQHRHRLQHLRPVCRCNKLSQIDLRS